jgi:hypothetical protein
MVLADDLGEGLRPQPVRQGPRGILLEMGGGEEIDHARDVGAAGGGVNWAAT